MNYIDIHTHTCYHDPETTLVLNVFPNDPDKLSLPVSLSVGLHPWHVDETWQEQVDLVGKTAIRENVLAIGEAGLDKVVESPFDLQIRAFKAQLSIAQFLKKPMIIHCVRSYSEMLALRKKSDQQVPWIFHWFNADVQIARELIRKNCYLSFGHMLFSEQSKAYKVFRSIPSDHVFFETDDAGYTIQEVYLQASAIRNIPLPELKKQIMNNFGRCFQY